MPSQPEKHLYEYATVRYVPSIERGEFVNIGLIMMCKRRRWVRVAVHIDQTRICSICDDPLFDVLRTQTEGFERVARGDKDGGPLAALPAEERFRWLTAVRSACLQTSRPHPGHTTSLDAEFDRLFNLLIL